MVKNATTPNLYSLLRNFLLFRKVDLLFSNYHLQCVYMYVCMHVCMDVCISVCEYECALHLCLYIHLRLQLYVLLCTHAVCGRMHVIFRFRLPGISLSQVLLYPPEL